MKMLFLRTLSFIMITILISSCAKEVFVKKPHLKKPHLKKPGTNKTANPKTRGNSESPTKGTSDPPTADVMKSALTDIIGDLHHFLTPSKLSNNDNCFFKTTGFGSAQEASCSFMCDDEKKNCISGKYIIKPNPNGRQGTANGNENDRITYKYENFKLEGTYPITINGTLNGSFWNSQGPSRFITIDGEIKIDKENVYSSRIKFTNAKIKSTNNSCELSISTITMIGQKEPSVTFIYTRTHDNSQSQIDLLDADNKKLLNTLLNK